MRVLAAHEDVIVVVSRVWRTAAVAVRGGAGGPGAEAFLIDSPVYPDELEALPALLAQAGFPVVGLLATHGDWDHLLGRLALPEAPLGCAESTAARLTGAPGEAQRELRAFDERHYVARPAPLSLPGTQALPVPGKLEVGDRELELHPADGHTEDGMAVVVPWAGVLVCGDYLSPVEIPVVEGSIGAYRATLARLEPLVRAAETVVAGHGGPVPRDQALTLLEEDAAYLDALSARGADAPLPAGRATREQRRLHAENAARLG